MTNTLTSFPTFEVPFGGVLPPFTPMAMRMHALTGVSAYPIAPGQGVVLDAIMPQPGKFRSSTSST
jgi:hypothetical protein